MSNTVTLTFAGDADALIKESKKVAAATDDIAKSTTRASRDLDTSAQASNDLTGRLGKLGAATVGATVALDEASAAIQAVVDIQQAGAEKASRLARALLDVEQAQEDYNQAARDGAQAGIDANQAALDAEQANLDAATALKDYNAAVKEHGKDSAEARQAQIDLKQAGIDLTQANEDAAQATRDAAQANIDAKTAQLDLSDAQREAHPPEMQSWADSIALVTPLLTGLVSVVALATAAQWSLNLAFLANPITWIIVGIVALVAAVVLIATKTTWFQTAWEKSWSFIKKAASSAWDFIKKIPGWIGTAFDKVADFITSPFKAAFNGIASAWNGTVGKLSFTVPGWVPGIGGAGFDVPDIPKFHSGGTMSGALGAEGLAVLQAGERITAGRHGADAGPLALVVRGGALPIEQALANLIATLITRRALNLMVAPGGRVTARA